MACHARTARRARRRPARGPVLPAGRFLHRPLAAGGARRHHARAFGPRPRRPRALPGPHRQRRHAAHAAGAGHQPADAALRRGHRAPRRARVAAPGRPCAGLGAGAAGTWRARVGGLGRLQDRARRHLHALRAGALRHLHHRVDLRPADLPLAHAGRAVRRDRRVVARQCAGRSRVGAVLLCLRQGAAHPAWRGREHRADRGARRGRALERGVPRRRRRAAADLARERRGRGCGAAEALAGARTAFGARHAVDEALRQLRRCVRERVDAAARHAAPARRGPRLRHVRPRRLARLAASDSGHRGRARVRHARQRAGDGAVADGSRIRCARLQDRVRRRGRPGRSRPFSARQGKAPEAPDAPDADAGSPHPGLPPEGEGADP
jgi:hypothetical protein